MGGPVVKVDSQIIGQIEKLASRGLTVSQICDTLRISRTTLYRRKRDNKKVEEALARGRAVGVMKVANQLFEDAVNGSTTAQIFYLKNRDPDNWNKATKIEADVTQHTTLEIKERKGMADYYADLETEAIEK